MAPNTPWHARAVTSIAKLTEAPPIADAAANPTRPVMKTTLRPMRSATRPLNSSRLPNDSEYAVTIHCRSTLLNPRSRCADGSARFITVMSSTTISCAMPDHDQDQPAPGIGHRARSVLRPAALPRRQGDACLGHSSHQSGGYSSIYGRA